VVKYDNQIFNLKREIMRKIIYLSAGLLLMLSSCKQNNRNDETQTDADKSEVERMFTTTYEDLIEDKANLEKDVIELKNERTNRAGQRTQEYDSLISNMEMKLREMEAKANEFRTATEDRREMLKDEFNLLENEVNDRISHVKNNFDRNNNPNRNN